MINVLTKKHFLILFFGSLYGSLAAQSYLGFNVDNDLYFGIDRYYSSGIFLEFGVLVNTPKDSLSKWGYVSRHWTLGQEINTPSLRQTEIISEMDYPYNGSLFLGYKNGGEVVETLKRVPDTKGTYNFEENDLFVRVKINSDAIKDSPPNTKETKQAWTQPILTSK